MKVGNINVDQKIGTVKLDDIILETPEGPLPGSRIDKIMPKMRGEIGSHAPDLFEIGVRPITNLKEQVGWQDGIIEINDFKVEPKILRLFKTNDFFKVTLVADFRPKYGQRFTYGMIHVELKNEPIDKKEDEPMIYSIAPIKIDDTVKMTKKVGVAPNFKFANIEPGFNYISESSYEELHPQIIGHFSSEKWAKWEFRTTNTVKEIVGTQIMEFVVKQPKNFESMVDVKIEGELNWLNMKARVKGFFKKGKFSRKLEEHPTEKYTIQG